MKFEERRGAGSMATMKYRKLRIAWSIAWSVLAALLPVLWARSYWEADWLMRATNTGTVQKLFGTDSGTLSYSHWTNLPPRYQVPGDWQYVITRPKPQNHTRWAFWDLSARGTFIGVALRLLVLITVVLAAAPWVRRRFGLRTLLIALILGLGI
jgi:hypothetical protein